MRYAPLLPVLLALAPAVRAAPGDCTAPAYRQLDFWIGDWDSHEDGGKGPVDARNRVSPILGGCVILEQYDQADGLRGESFSVYDATRQVWHQTWVTNSGTLLLLEGRFQGDSLVLIGSNRDSHGKPQTIKGIWKAQGPGVRETAYVSHDGGKTWADYFDILFLKHIPNTLEQSEVSAAAGDAGVTMSENSGNRVGG